MDASDQCSLSRIWGGIHPGCDDLPGRHMGEAIAPESYWKAVRYFNGQISCPADMTADHAVDVADLLALLSSWGECSFCSTDIDGDGMVGVTDLLGVLSAWGACD
jgi:hypothetical protein